MILCINTTRGQDITIGLLEGSKFLFKKKFAAEYSQAEKLLPEIAKMLKTRKLDISEVKGIEVENRGGSFTALRIGVVTANALGYALGIPVKSRIKNEARPVHPADLRGKQSEDRELRMENVSSIVKPVYDKEPNITIKNSKIKN